MPGVEVAARSPAVPARSAGFWGKLPARGDFVRLGLPRSFVDPWDDWMQQAIAGSQAVLGEATWRTVWLEAPIWRFRLASGVCGPMPATGLWVPSVDRAGRFYPLTLAVLGPDDGAHDPWLDLAEDAALAALQDDWPPESLGAALDGMPPAEARPQTRIPPDLARCLWWTQGGPHVDAAVLPLPVLPGADAFAAMLCRPVRVSDPLGSDA